MTPPFQKRVHPWLLHCFGSIDPDERSHRFLEESLELVQALNCSKEDVLTLVDYVYGRPVGEVPQEIGGVMITLAALCIANHQDMHVAGDVELSRVWKITEQIRAKQAGKPKNSPLPTSVSPVNSGCARQAFESSVFCKSPETFQHGATGDAPGFYTDPDTEYAWKIWQAARISNSP